MSNSIRSPWGGPISRPAVLSAARARGIYPPRDRTAGADAHLRVSLAATADRNFGAGADMGKRTTRHPMKAKRLALRAAPLLLTEIRSAQWNGGVLFLDVESGPEAGALALGSNVVLQLWQSLQVSIRDNAAPFNRTRADPVGSPTQEKDKP